MVKLGVIGLGKMGLSHFAIANAHPKTDVIACERSGLVLDALKKYTSTKTYKEYDALLEGEALDAVIIATPSRLHGEMVKAALDRGIHVFCEKPFCLDWRESKALAELAEAKNLINQVGYHNRHVAPFQEAKRILDSGALGDVTHVLAEAYGPVVLRAKGSTWRTKAEEGGGCLYDYAAHPINLVNWYFGAPEKVSGSLRNAIFSAQTEDEVYSTFHYPGGMSVHLSTNWSDESYRKMSTKLTISGTKGRIVVDRLDIQIYLREECPALPEYQKGWNIRYLTDFESPIGFYLRGEEYSDQIEQFVAGVIDGRQYSANDFRSAAETDYTISQIVADAPAVARSAGADAGSEKTGKSGRSWFGMG